MNQRERDHADHIIRDLEARKAHRKRVAVVAALFCSGAAIWVLLWWLLESIIRRMTWL